MLQIDMIITSMINKFKRLHYFLKELWVGFIAIAQLEESNNTFSKKSDSALRFYQNKVKKFFKLGTLQELDGLMELTGNRTIEYCAPITKNKEMIKITVLQYVDQIVEFYYKVVFAYIFLIKALFVLGTKGHSSFQARYSRLVKEVHHVFSKR